MSKAERPPIKSYTTVDGLPHDSVNKIVQDSRGFLWFCTAEGLSRFDGYRFKNYTQEEGLPHRNITDLLETHTGAYIIATSAGISIFNPNGKAYRWNIVESRLERTAADPPLFKTIVPQSRSHRHSASVLSLVEDGLSRIWVGTDGGLFVLEASGGDWKLREFDLEPKLTPSVTSLIQEPSGGVLAATSTGLYWISRDREPKRLLNDFVGSTFLDRSGRLWVNTVVKLQLFAFADERLALLHSFSPDDGLPPNAIHFRVHQTSDGRIYIGFEYGFGELFPDPTSGKFKFRMFERERINAFAEDTRGALWVATDTKGIWKLSANGFTVFGAEDGLSSTDEIMSVFPDANDGIYITSRPNKLSHLSSKGFENVVPFGLSSRSWGWHNLDLISKEGEWWVPGVEGLRHYPKISSFAALARTPPTHVFNSADGLFSDQIFAQFEDSHGDLWFSVIGPIQDTLLRWDRRTLNIVRYTAADGLPSGNGPISFAESPDSDVWFGYYFGGLVRFRDGHFRLFTEADGLPMSQVTDLLSDSSGRLWIELLVEDCFTSTM